MAITVHQSFSFSKRTTLRMGGDALAEVVFTHADDCEQLPELLASLGGEPLVIGRGSNLLAKDGELPFVIINPAVTTDPVCVEETDDTVTVHVGAGFRLPRFLNWCATRGYSGLEGLAGVPGTVGGAVAMNAGSYGCEVVDCLESVEVFEKSIGTVVFKKTDVVLQYRHFSIPTVNDQPVILSSAFTLQKTDPQKIKKVIDDNLTRKKATQPVSAHSAGCVFKNPAEGVSAGKLLDQCGFKGKIHGGVAFSPLHANFLININNGTSKEAFELLHMAQNTVLEQTGYSLELEVKVIG
ncbi:UDP-N-acetylmuramate dehydrogenase [Halodesulfovibrio marinisediminis]|uniref:UDP-N-acetylenolpyruvoylglucosamine reductase n=1 Tax=Halodesulfovibrio marinisediminis DSM 17456 TaxID=1121457 RepID=A0A1N6HJE0_9BACT|nr:UDP-N-acetylmuramate dehydrogenase [Halodesulfovibrio marinisediminis]SIO19847.1 UDP-N-acetylmuramate dehydrogenase [Halodesulfovibrio marinisediminis DSM 17456]